MDDERKVFINNSAIFKAGTKYAFTLAKTIEDVEADEALEWALRIYVRMCAASNSIVSLLSAGNSYRQKGSLDHGSILSICRIVIECHIMLEYATDRNMNVGQFLLKRMIFNIHDCSNRLRFFRGMGESEETKKQASQLDDLRVAIKEHLWFAELSPQKQADILDGRVMYLDGFRSAAEQAGWKSGEFDAVYAYLSAQIHSAPLSFYRMGERGINYQKVSPYQYGVVAYALELTGWSLNQATKRITELFPVAARQSQSMKSFLGVWMFRVRNLLSRN